MSKFSLPLLFLAVSVAAKAQDASAAPVAPAPPPPDPLAAPAPFELGKLKVSIAGDGYYLFNANRPANHVNTFYNFDDLDKFQLNMARMALDIDPAPIGIHFEVGAGRMYDMIHYWEPKDVGKWSEYIPQMYVTLKPQSWKGLQFDFGKFYTSAGAEVTETYPNWNYSRSLLFSFGPYYHFGLRVTKPWGEHFTTGVQVVNGWNNIIDNNGGKTVGITTSATFGKFAWANNYYFGPEQTNVSSNFRNFYDTVLTYTHNDRVASYFNMDIGREKFAPGNSSGWLALAGAMHIGLTKRLYFSPRIELYNDYDGWATGTPQRIKEVTFTGEYKLHRALNARVEYRHDWSNVTSFMVAPGRDPLRHQNTVAIGLIALLGKM